MSKRQKREILTAVEVGTHTIKVVMGEFLPDQVLSLIGVGVEPSRKVMKGEVVDAGVVQEQLQKALVAAEDASGADIENIFLAVTGGHIGSVNSVGSTLTNSQDHRIYEEDRDAAMQNAVGFTLPPDKRPMHFFPRQYRVDGREVNNPVGMFGGKIEADAHIVYGLANRLEISRNMIVEAVGLESEPRDLVFSAVAAGIGAFGREEIEQGALIIDLGAGVTEYAVFQGTEQCLHTAQITVGCEHIANDLSLGLRLPILRGRELLERLGHFGAAAVMTPDGNTRLTQVELAQGKPPRSIPVSSVEQIVEMRLQELFEHILADLAAKDMIKRIGYGAKLCGGGALIPRITELAQRVFEMPVEVARPRLVSGQKEIVNSPVFVTPIGVLRYGKAMLELGGRDRVPVKEVIRNEIQHIFEVFRKGRPFQW